MLSLWIAGAGCMFGCENMITAAGTGADASSGEHGPATIVSDESCASTGSHDCCAQKKASTQAKPQAKTRVSLQLATRLVLSESLNPSRSGGMSECPLALSRAVAITKATDNKQLADSVATGFTAPLISDSPEQHTALSPMARLPNRGHTYLRCCVFLI